MKAGSAIMREAEKHGAGADLAPGSRFFLPFACSPGTRSLWREQTSSEQIQVRECKSGKEPRGVLGQAAIAHLREAPQSLHHMKGVFATSSRGRAQAVESALQSAQRP